MIDVVLRHVGAPAVYARSQTIVEARRTLGYWECCYDAKALMYCFGGVVLAKALTSSTLRPYPLEV